MKKIIIVALLVAHLCSLFGCVRTTELGNFGPALSGNPGDASLPPTDIPQETDDAGPAESCLHLWEQWKEITAASCENTGLEERICSKCGETEVKEHAKLAHKESNWIIDKPAEVGVEGNKHTECVYCRKQLKQETIAALLEEHTHAVAGCSVTKNAGCTESGSQQLICGCGEIIAIETIPPKGHSIIIDEAKAATCTTSGQTEGSHCGVCGITIVPQEVIAPLGHAYLQTEVQPSPFSSGYTLHTCSTCGHSYQDTYTEFDYAPTASLIYQSNGDGTCAVIGITDSTAQYIVIPEKSPEGDVVVSIANEAFSENDSIAYVSMPNTVTLIGYKAFYSCKKLKTVMFPKNGNGTLTLNYQSFAFCGLEEIDMSETHMEVVAAHAFYGCTDLKRVQLNGVETIEDFAFATCSALEELIHTGELSTIGERAFEYCKKLTVLRGRNAQSNLDTVLVFGYHSFWHSGIRNIVFNKNLKATNGAFEYCTNLGTLDFSQTNVFGGFAYSKIEKLVFPRDVTMIGRKLFSGTRIEELILPDSVTEIGDEAFYEARIGKIVFGSGLTAIGDRAFKDAVAEYDFSKITQTLTIGSEAFANNTFTTFAFPASTVSIGQAALMGCNNLKVLSIPFIGENTNQSISSIDCFAWLFGYSVDCWDQDEVVPASLKTLIIRGENLDTRDLMGVGIRGLVVGGDITIIGAENFGSDSTLQRVFFEGTEEQWNAISINAFGNDKLLSAEKYFYSKEKPTVSGKFWHYDENGNITIW